MVSVFQPHVLLELKKHDKSRIEVVTSYADRLLVGLSTGDLRVYRINDGKTSRSPNDGGAPGLVKPGQHDGSHSPPIELLREVEKFSRKAPLKLACITQLNVLVSLGDGFVTLYDLQNFVLAERLEQTKGATTFALSPVVTQDEGEGIAASLLHLAVAVKRKIMIWSWHDTKLVPTPAEINLPAVAKSLMWMTGTKLVAGMDPGYVLIDVKTNSMKEITRPSLSEEAETGGGSRFGAVNSSSMGYMGMSNWIPKPMALLLGENEVLLAKDVNTLFINDSGEALAKRQVPWAAAPEAVEYAYPYILALQAPTKGSVEVRNPQSLSLLQNISLPSASLLHVSSSDRRIQDPLSQTVLVASDRCIWRMDVKSYSGQIDDLLSRRKFDEAASLTGLLDERLLLDKRAKSREIQILKGEELFVRHKYRDAMTLFIETSAPPQRIILKYPESIAGHQNSEAPAEISHENSGASNAPPSDEMIATEPTPPVAISEGKAGRASLEGPNAAASIRSADSDTRSVMNAALGTGDNINHDGEALNTATKALFGFLAHTRKQVQRFLNFDGTLKDTTNDHGSPEVPPYIYLLDSAALHSNDADWPKQLLQTAILVDTTLFRAYMHSSPRLAGSLFRIDNFCAPDVVEEKLYENGNYVDLIDFLHGKKLHRQALELLEKLGRSASDSSVEDSLRGPGKVVAYLKQLPPEQLELIFKFAPWPIKADPQLGMQIFTADTSNAESLPRSKVLSFLEDHNTELAMEYLEHIIQEFRDDSSTFHERLIRLYLSSIRTGQSSKKEELRARLEAFLRQKEHYDSSKLLKEMPDNDPMLFESRAILHSKLHHHLQALEIYVYKMHSPSKAESYCNAVYLANAGVATILLDEGDSVYTMLLSMLLNPPAPQSGDLTAALDLLSRHGTRIPALSTLDFLPSDLSVEKLEAYLRGRMRAANSLAREQEVARALAGVEKAIVDIKLQVGDGDDNPEIGYRGDGAQVNRGQNRRVVLSEDRMCSGCHKRFGRAAVRVWPSGEIRHYGCGEPRGTKRDSTDAISLQRRSRPSSARA